jgi:hypothetical protein
VLEDHLADLAARSLPLAARDTVFVAFLHRCHAKLIQINSGSLMFTLSGCLAMSQDLTPLLDHLNGLIFLADVAWHRPSGKYADMACTFQRLGRAYQAAALAQREGRPVRL